MKTKRTLLISSIIVLLCISVIAGMTWALFSDSHTVRNHLKAGKLDITLVRTQLTYCTLNDEGVLEETELHIPLDLTKSTNENVFGISSDEVAVVPGTYFDAKLELRKSSTVAFNYTIDIVLFTDTTDEDESNDAPNALAEQLQVTVTHPDGRETVKMLSELKDGLSIDSGYVGLNDNVEAFNVRVDFIGDALNDAAQGQTVVFDLIITATQATETPAP